MKTFLLKVGLAGLGCTVLFLLTILATEIKTVSTVLPFQAPITIGETSHQWRRQREADTTLNVDILIVGSSLAQSVDVREVEKYKLRAFNLASGSQTPIQTRYLFEKYLNDFNPKLIIWDVHPYTFANTGVESTIDLISNCQDCSGMIPLLYSTNSSIAWNTFLKRMMLKPFEKQDFTVPTESRISKYYYGGYMEVYLKAPASPAKIDEFQYQGLKIQKETLESELKKLKQKHIPVVLIYSPKSDEFIASFQNQQDWFAYYNSLVSQGLADSFLSFNELFSGQQQSEGNFYDIAHLTHSGAKKYNKALFSSLSESLSRLEKTKRPFDFAQGDKPTTPDHYRGN